MKILEKRNERAKALHDARGIKERADAEKRDMSADEKENFDKLMDVVDDLQKQIEAMKSGEESEADRDDDEKKDDDKARLEAALRDEDEDKKEASRRAPK